ncbi:MAG TPA: CARDB domain-containing protein [Spirochaetia bacterium]|nr:CARDB domain-containing protein [Spirochaetia bacterium]
MKPLIGLFALPILVLLSCSSPIIPAASTSSNTSSGTPPTSAPLSVQNESNQAVLLTETGNRLNISSTDSTGATVDCASATGVTRFEDSGNSSDTTSPALIVGTTRDGRAGIWAYSQNHIESVISEKDGKGVSVLPETDEANGAFAGHLGWTYHVMGTSGDGHMIIGYAENKNGINFGKWTIAPGTTVGVYWTVSLYRHERHLQVSGAKVIGTYAPSTVDDNHRHGHHFFDYLKRLVLDRLKLLLLNELTSYLTMVEKDGISIDKSTGDYQVLGTDQDGEAALATIDRRGEITIAATTSTPSTTTTGAVDLAPGNVSTAGTSVQQGGSITVTLPVQNLATGSVSGPIAVNFYLATSSTFNPATDTSLGSASFSNIGSNATVNVNTSLTITATTANLVYYLYAVVDPAGDVVDTNTANNTSTVAEALRLLVYATPSPQSYPLYVETYAPAGGGTATTAIALYKKTSTGVVQYQGENVGAYPGATAVLDFTATGSELTSGTYYVLVWIPNPYSFYSGAYALEVRSANVGQVSFNALSSEPTASNNNTIITLNASTVPFNTTEPTNAYSVPVGQAVNWYIPYQGYDWFTFTLP